MTVILDLNAKGLESYQQGAYKKAIEYFEQALTIDKNAHGEMHSSVASTLNNLALAWRGLGNFQKAKECLESALTIRQAILGDEHPSTVKVKASLAVVELKLKSAKD